MNCLDDHLHKFILNNNTKKINHYKVLNIDTNSSPEDVRKSYLTLSRIYHPDKCKDVHATELFKLISNSYLALTNTTTDVKTEITIEDALDLFFNSVINDTTRANLYTKMILKPKDLTINETITLGYSFYTLFIKKWN